MGISIPPRGDSDRKVGANFAPLSVAPQDEPNMTVKIRAGSFWTALGEYIEFAGGNTIPLTIPTAGNARWDLITIDTNSVVKVTEGTEGLAPQLPAVPDNELQLAAVFMRDDTISVKADMVFDVRPLFVAKHETLADLSAQLGLKADLTYVDNNLNTKADVGGTPEASFILNQDLTGAGATNAAFVVERGSAANVEIRWNEALTQWELSNDGTNYLPIETASIAWGDILGTLSAQTDLQAALDLKSDASHTHLKVDITDFAHTHLKADITDFAHTHLKVDITDFNDADYATAAQGVLADSALQVAPVASVNALTGVIVLTTTEIAEGVNEYYTEAKVSANTNVAANTAHTVATGNPHNTNVNDLADTTITAPVDNEVLTYVAGDWVNLPAPGSAAPAWGTITGTLSAQLDLQAALDLKAGTVHTHVKADITDFAHTHVAADVTDFAVTVDAQIALASIDALVDVDTTTATPVATNVLKFDGANWVPAADNNATALGYTASPTDGTVTSDTGTDATLTVADAINAGLLAPADFTQLSTLVADLAGKAPTVHTHVVADVTDFDAGVDANATVIANAAHAALVVGNPHAVTATEVGLGNVDDTADLAKPISTATQTALDLKADLASPVLTGLPVLPQTVKAGLTLGVGLAAVPVGSTTFVTDDAGASVFILAYVDASITWIRSDDLTAIS